ncbi:hypothetical protein B0T11DRAFT_317954 [Plectosphaerella cucumerina]|uniref:F-box domain-containing protein n=1 Tax=Plectosphaerella cucumerina TaxID=40658 RepID=A0A8K0X3H1_9PEZI|nr:hypothetical protein B0T11DRAFT_317954 [Plectosphaerella cucumerina]
MPSISDLPTEILSAILLHATEEDCLSLATVDRRLHSVATEQLYRNITMDWLNYKLPPVSKLLRTLIDNQSLRYLVKSLELQGGCGSTPRVYHVPKIPLTFDQEKASLLIRGTHFPHTERWEDDLREGSLDAAVTLIVMLLPNLVRLTLLDNFARDNRLLNQTCIHALKSKMCHDGTNSSVEDPWSNLSKLCDRLRLSIDNPFDFTWPFPLPPRAQTLRYLALDKIRECRALPILAACPELKELAWNLRHENGSDPGVISEDEACIDLRQVTAALACLHDSLEILSLGAECYGGRSEIEDPPMTLLGSIDLGPFTKMKNLTVPWNFSMGMRPGHKKIGHPGTLPKSLTSLLFVHNLGCNQGDDWWDKDFPETCREYLEETRLRYTPHLGHFGFIATFDSASTAEKLEKMCKYAGISGTFLDNEM